MFDSELSYSADKESVEEKKEEKDRFTMSSNNFNEDYVQELLPCLKYQNALNLVWLEEYASKGEE